MKNIRRFHELADLPIDQPMTGQILKERGGPLLEEMVEVRESFWHLQGIVRGHHSGTSHPQAKEDLLKELCDVVYTIKSFCLALGWDFDQAMTRVDNSNLTKVTHGVIKDDEGKVMKGPNYVPPILADLVGPQAPDLTAAKAAPVSLPDDSPGLKELTALRKSHGWCTNDLHQWHSFCSECGVGTSSSAALETRHSQKSMGCCGGRYQPLEAFESPKLTGDLVTDCKPLMPPELPGLKDLIADITAPTAGLREVLMEATVDDCPVGSKRYHAMLERLESAVLDHFKVEALSE